MAYFNEHAGTQILEAQVILVDGGCSGNLFDIYRDGYGSKTFTNAPCFIPVKGIVQSAEFTMELCQGYEGLMNELEKSATKYNRVLLNFPGNPDGQLPTETQLNYILKSAKEKELTLIIDATYFNMLTEADRPAYHKLMKNVIQSDQIRWVILASATKAFGLCPFRTGIVLADPVTAVQLKEKSPFPQPNYLAQLALSTTLATPDSANAVTNTVMATVRQNEIIIQAILDQKLNIGMDEQTLSQEIKKLVGIPATSSQKMELIPDYIAFMKVVDEFSRSHSDKKLTLSQRQGALYIQLHAPKGTEKTLRDLLTTYKIALVPDYIFQGVTPQNLDKVKTEPASWYRMAPLAPAIQETKIAT